MATELNTGFPFYVVIYLFVCIKLWRRKNIKDFFWFSSFLIYIFMVIDITIFPIPTSLARIENNFIIRHGEPIWNSVHLIPNLTIRNFLSRNFVLNMIMFAPFGFLANMVFKVKRRFLETFFYSFVFTVSIEFTQFVFLYFCGSFKIVDIDDVFANVIGAMIGLLIYLLAEFVLRNYTKQKAEH